MYSPSWLFLNPGRLEIRRRHTLARNISGIGCRHIDNNVTRSITACHLCFRTHFVLNLRPCKAGHGGPGNAQLCESNKEHTLNQFDIYLSGQSMTTSDYVVFPDDLDSEINRMDYT